MIHIILIGGSRFLWRIFRDRYISKPEAKKRTLIVGAGAAGAMIARQLNNGTTIRNCGRSHSSMMPEETEDASVQFTGHRYGERYSEHRRGEKYRTYRHRNSFFKKK